MRRGLVSALHWGAFFLVLTMVKGGVSHPWVLALFVALIAAWGALTLRRGMQARPGPKLSAPLRQAYPWMHRALHLLLILTAIAIAARLAGRSLPLLDAWTLLLVTLAAGTFHGLFHVWRHMALYDNALHLITPRWMHKWL
ncbi:hypothetical protein [Sulfitobacter sp. S190]|uniref:hypothetical protein n=1 Tax=Sulfitobacter sp. S190 TaxID=2867022 RepID=UPI0021A7DD5D|nr:hypothetical protein [Sulfitobacter sp. S190]UWR21563.1 hypothetical protein K3756_12770 [Sulfitobacter sp. S190]